MLMLPDLLDYWVAYRGESEAVVCGTTRLSWIEFRRDVHAVAAALQNAGVKQGDRVGLFLNNSAEWVVIYVAITVSGGVVVPLNPRFGRFELRGIEADAECTAIISTPPFCHALDDRFVFENAPQGEITIAPKVGAGLAPILYRDAIAASGTPVKPQLQPSDLLGIYYTSGTTGLPKGTMQTHAGVMVCITSQLLSFGLNSNDRGLIIAPLSFTGACLSMLTPLLTVGACAVIEPVYQAERMLEVIQSEKITYISAVPAIWERLPALPVFGTADLSSLRVACTGGAPVPPVLLAQFREKNVTIRQVYGATEAGTLISVPNETMALTNPASAGLPLVSLRVRAIRDDGTDCAPGEIGEICIKGAQVMRGYWRNPEATEKAFIDGWYKTGDLGSLDANGCITVADRLKNMIISGGVNIYPAEIERAMASITAIEEVAVFGIADEKWGQRPICLIYSSRPLDIEAVKAEARELLGPMKAPRDIVQCREPLPRTVTNKISRQDLHAVYIAQNAPAAAAV